MKELNLQEIHAATLVVLKKIHEICEKIGVKYFLAYGTLLGAVRHKGFIPWDDDADIWMFRKDYEFFFKYIKEHGEELYPLSYCSRAKTDNYEYAINRVTDMRYQYVDTVKSIEMDYGVFVDVYPLDFVGNKYSEYLSKYNKIEKLNTLYYLYLNEKFTSSSIIKSVAKRITRNILHCFFLSANDLLAYVENKTKKIIGTENECNSKLLGVVIWWAYKKTYEKSLFEDRVLLELDGEFFYAPKHYKELLTLTYGDYMKLPPLEKRTPYHGYKIYKR